MTKFSTPLLKATLLRRYKRFFIDAELEDGTVVTAHCPNTGSMLSCCEPGMTIYLQPSSDPKRKLKFTWEYAEAPAGLIGINTARANEIVERGLRANLIGPLQGYRNIRREVRYGASTRFDFYLSDHLTGASDCYLEVKNLTLFQSPYLCFPDAVTERGLKHLRALEQCKAEGFRAVLIFLVNRQECVSVKTAVEIDPDYAQALTCAYQNGVEVYAFRSINQLDGAYVGEELTFLHS
jgi:sugar fermentation stimulation protein A